jgi:hypothetical protein
MDADADAGSVAALHTSTVQQGSARLHLPAIREYCCFLA